MEDNYCHMPSGSGGTATVDPELSELTDWDLSDDPYNEVVIG